MDFLDRNIGRCPKCMGQAFLAALIASAFVFAAIALDLHIGIVTIAVVAAAGATALWLAHIVAYALRTTMLEKTAEDDGAAVDMKLSRRAFAATFAKTAAYAIVTTALAVASTSAFAQNRCDCSRCSSSQVCCRTANGGCGCFPASIRC
jgi:hypothetical protein